MHPSQHKVPIIVVLKNALLERGWVVIDGAKENASGEMREWTHPNYKRPITLIEALWIQEGWDWQHEQEQDSR